MTQPLVTPGQAPHRQEWGPLGLHAKSAVTPRETYAKAAAGVVCDLGLHRSMKMQRKAAQILNDLVPRIDKYGNERSHYKFRVAMCTRGTDGGPVIVRRSPDHQRADFLGVQTCGSVWHCPLCAPKVANERRDEMNQAIAGHLHAAGAVAFATYTFQHTKEEGGQGCLHAQERRLAAALSNFKGSKAYRALMQAADFVGAIRAIEITYGEIHGWHPHAHELLYISKGCLDLLRRRLRKLWAHELVKRDMAGLSDGDTALERRAKLRYLLERCCTVQNGSYAAAYVAEFGREPLTMEGGRWGIASEMTKSHLKLGRLKHCSSWQLLRDAEQGDKRSAGLFREFALAMQGKRQLYWSKGLKARFGIGDASDEEIAASPDTRCTEHVIEIGPTAWALVISHEARFDVLDAAMTDGRAGVGALLDRLRAQPPTHSGTFTETTAVFAVPKRKAAA